MIIYLLIFVLTATVAFAEVFGKEMRAEVRFGIIVLYTTFLICFVGFRDCGFDYENYRYYYDVLHSSFWQNNSEYLMVEKGYALLNYLMPSFRLLYVLFAVLSCTLLSRYLYKNSYYPMMSHFLLLGVLIYLYFMGQYRQGLAIAIVLPALVCRSRTRRLMLIILATMVHNSAFIALLSFFVPKNYIKGRYYLMLLMAALVVNIGMTNIFTQYIGIFPEFISQKLEFYSESEEGLRFGLNLAMLLRLTVFFIFYLYRHEIEKNEGGTLLFNYYFLSMLIYLGLGFLPQLSGRGSIYFYISEVILIPMVLYGIPNLKQKAMVFAFFLLIGTYRQVSFFRTAGEEFLPYRSVISKIF